MHRESQWQKGEIDQDQEICHCYTTTKTSNNNPSRQHLGGEVLPDDPVSQVKEEQNLKETDGGAEGPDDMEGVDQDQRAHGRGETER